MELLILLRGTKLSSDDLEARLKDAAARTSRGRLVWNSQESKKSLKLKKTPFSLSPSLLLFFVIFVSVN